MCACRCAVTAASRTSEISPASSTGWFSTTPLESTATTVTWLAVTFMTKPESDETLGAFYARVRPTGPGWRAVAERTGIAPQGPGLGVRLRDWALGCVMIHAALADREQRRKRLRADPPARRSMPPAPSHAAR